MPILDSDSVVLLAKEGSKLLVEGSTDSAIFEQLAGWLDEALEQSADVAISEVSHRVKAESADADRYLTRAMRVVAGTQAVTVADDADEWLHLLAIPLFFFPRENSDVSEVLTHLECRSELERSLEHALGLDFASLRLCDHPVNVIDMESLSMSETRRVAGDLLNMGDSAFLTPPVIDVGMSAEGAHHLSLLWPAVWKVSGVHRDEQLARISGALRKSRELSQFKHRADELLEQEMLAKWGVSVRPEIYMPALFHDVFAVYRLVELNIMMNNALSQFKSSCNSVSFGFFGNKLRYSLLDTAGKVLTANELRAPDESAKTISAAVRAACARHGVACTASLNLSSSRGTGK